MKQNERILVYLVTGFLAVILVVAVFFGRDGKPVAAPRSDDTVRGLGQILDQEPIAEDGLGSLGQKNLGQNNPGAAGPASEEFLGGSDGNVPAAQGGNGPLVASMPVAASARVAQLFGESRRDRSVRIVRAIGGDSLETLVRRWCGKRDPYLEEAKALNEELTILRVGQEVVVPWVDDEVVFAAYEARQPVLLADGPRSTPVADLGGQPVGETRPGGPSFQVPGTATVANPGSVPVGTAGPIALGETYVVQKNDSLWKIAATRYGTRNAPRMIEAIKQQNGLTSDDLKVDQKLVLPAAN